MGDYRISELAERSGFPASTLRFYEHAGLLVAARSPAGYRLYDDAALERLRFIAAGNGILPLEEIHVANAPKLCVTKASASGARRRVSRSCC